MILKRLRNIENEDIFFIIGIKFEELELIDGIIFYVFDFGGFFKMRFVWKFCLEEMDFEGSNCKNVKMLYDIDIEM